MLSMQPYWWHQENETTVRSVSRTKLVGVELFSYVNTYFTFQLISTVVAHVKTFFNNAQTFGMTGQNKTQ